MKDEYPMTFCHWLTLLFIGLQLCGVITWSWWLVLLPLIILFVLSFLKGLVSGGK